MEHYWRYQGNSRHTALVAKRIKIMTEELKDMAPSSAPSSFPSRSSPPSGHFSRKAEDTRDKEEEARRFQELARTDFDAWATAIEAGLKKKPLEPAVLEAQLAQQKEVRCQELAAKLAFLPRVHLEDALGKLATYILAAGIKLEKANKKSWVNKMYWDKLKAAGSEAGKMLLDAIWQEIKRIGWWLLQEVWRAILEKFMPALTWFARKVIGFFAPGPLGN